MSIKDQIKTDLIESQKAKEAEKVQVLRSLMSSIKNAEIDSKGELSEDDQIAVLRSEAKQRKDAIEQYQKGGREELAEKERREIEIIEKYLPKMMEEKEIEDEVNRIIEETGASDISDMGKVMGPVMSKLKGKAEGETVKKIVTEKLS
jgi:hypothetical protein